MNALWEKFLFYFCKAGFLCSHTEGFLDWQGGPNTLGWIAIAFFALLIVGSFFLVIGKRGN